MKKLALLAAAVVLTLGPVPTTEAGRNPGPGAAVSRVPANGTTTYHATFRAGEAAVVSIRGDGDTDVDVFVYDDAGNLITSGVGLTDVETVSWTPRWTGTFRIVLRNLGGVWNEVRLTTN